jgi:hypothetical protein
MRSSSGGCDAKSFAMSPPRMPNARIPSGMPSSICTRRNESSALAMSRRLVNIAPPSSARNSR